jgi:hypothetical protein
MCDGGGSLDPWDYSVEAGATVVYFDDLPPERRGAYLDDLDLIVLRPSLTRVQEDESLAHELGHRHYRHRRCGEDVDRIANRWAARLLITDAAYAVAERINANPMAIARELGVTVHMVYHYQQHLAESRRARA